MRVDVFQEAFEILRHRVQHDLPHAVVVLGQQMLLETVALIEAERNFERPVAAELFELIDAVLENIHGLEARLQVVAVLLQTHHVVEVSLHI